MTRCWILAPNAHVPDMEEREGWGLPDAPSKSDEYDAEVPWPGGENTAHGDDD
jgi:hypothetical protein